VIEVFITFGNKSGLYFDVFQIGLTQRLIMNVWLFQSGYLKEHKFFQKKHLPGEEDPKCLATIL
jgi:hypothetical protein